MGSFSWLKADSLTNVANVVYGKPYKFLIPREFGGGFIKDIYQDYGTLGRKEKYDILEILAFWNSESIVDVSNGNFQIAEKLKYDGDFPLMKEIDSFTDCNRKIGISVFFHAKTYEELKYPLKLVSASYKGTYEDCKGRSYRDPYQGCCALYRNKM